MLLESSVAGFTKSKLLFYHSENMFHFGAYRRFLAFSVFDLSLGAGRTFFACTGPASELVTDRPSIVILFLCFRPFVGIKISAVSIDHFLFSGQQIGGNSNIMYVGGSYLHGMNQTALAIYTDVCLIAKMPCVSLFRRMSLRIPLLVLVFGGGRRFNKRMTPRSNGCLGSSFYTLYTELISGSII